jgi:hypothetical protein
MAIPTVIVLLVVAFFLWLRPGTPSAAPVAPGAFATQRSHSQFGAIYMTQAVDLSELRPSPPSLIRRLLGNPTQVPVDPVYLGVGPHQLEWSVCDPDGGTGWIYFHQPQSNRAVWEFAPIEAARLEEVTDEDLKQTLYSRDTSSGWKTVFDAGAYGTGFRVAVGEVYLAKHIDDTNHVYAIELTDQNGGALKTHFLAADADQ